MIIPAATTLHMRNRKGSSHGNCNRYDACSGGNSWSWAGNAGCSGLAEALVEGEVTVVGTCKPCKPDQKAAIAEYLNTTPGPDGTCVKVKA